MNTKQARQYLLAYRPSGADDGDRSIRAAMKTAASTPELQAEFHNQLAFDRALAGRLDAIVPDDLAEPLTEAAARLLTKKHRRLSLRDPAMLSVGLAFLVLIGLGVWIFLGKANSFAGMDEVTEMAQAGDKAQPSEFQELETKAGTLTDWFAMQDFDGFAVPPGMENAPVVGVRVFKYEDVPVATAAVARPRAFFYVFEAQPFGISLPEGEWRMLEYGDKTRRTLAIRQIGNMAFVVALRGSKADMQSYLNSIRPPGH